MPPKLFLDANILFTSAISHKGLASAILHLASLDRCLLLTSPFAVEEARRNLQLKYPEKLEAVESHLERVLVVSEADLAVTSWAREHVVAKDAPILAAAVACGAEYLVTGDRRHFGKLFGSSLRTVTVVTLARAVELVLNRRT